MNTDIHTYETGDRKEWRQHTKGRWMRRTRTWMGWRDGEGKKKKQDKTEPTRGHSRPTIPILHYRLVRHGSSKWGIPRHSHAPGSIFPFSDPVCDGWCDEQNADRPQNDTQSTSTTRQKRKCHCCCCVILICVLRRLISAHWLAEIHSPSDQTSIDSVDRHQLQQYGDDIEDRLYLCMSSP